MTCDNPLWSIEESCESAIIAQHPAQLSHTSSTRLGCSKTDNPGMHWLDQVIYTPLGNIYTFFL